MLPATHDAVLSNANLAEKAQIEARDRYDTACTAIALAMPDALIIPLDIALKVTLIGLKERHV